jgi:signal transduction histidine kinase
VPLTCQFQLTGGIAHDFNNMLTGIVGSLDIIRRRMAAGNVADIPRFMDAATTSAQRAAALTHRLLSFARRQSLPAGSPNFADDPDDRVQTGVFAEPS